MYLACVFTFKIAFNPHSTLNSSYSCFRDEEIKTESLNNANLLR